MSSSRPTVRQATLQLLRDLGIQTIFGNPGSTELPLFRDFPDDFRYILGLQEAVVVGMADGFAQASGTAAFVNLHSSAGTGHALGNLFTAFRNQSPLLVTAGQQARAMLPFEPFLFAERPTEFPRPFIKWACEPARAEDVPIAIARAYHEAMTPPFGPVFVSVPVDDWDAPSDWLKVRKVANMNPGDPAAVHALAAAINAAKRPAFVLGAGVARDGAWSEMLHLAEMRQASVFAGVYANRNVFPESHSLFQGFLPPFRERMLQALEDHDLVVSFGGPLNLYHAEGNGPLLADGTDCWIVADNPGTLAWAPIGNGLLGNIKAVAGQLGTLVQPGAQSADKKRVPRIELDPDHFDDRLVMQRLSELRGDAILVEEAPTTRAALNDQVRLDEPDTFFSSASGGLGHSMPAAVGIALANPDKRVIAVIGDGSAMYAIQSLFAAQQLQSRITIVIVNNSRYEALRMFGRTFGMPHVVGTDLAGLDFIALAKGHGVESAVRVTDAASFDHALEQALSADGPSLIEAVVVS